MAAIFKNSWNFHYQKYCFVDFITRNNSYYLCMWDLGLYMDIIARCRLYRKQGIGEESQGKCVGLTSVLNLWMHAVWNWSISWAIYQQFMVIIMARFRHWTMTAVVMVMHVWCTVLCMFGVLSKVWKYIWHRQAALDWSLEGPLVLVLCPTMFIKTQYIGTTNVGQSFRTTSSAHVSS